MFRVELTKVAERELTCLYKTNERIFERVNSALDAIAKNPYEGKPLKNVLKGSYSYRVGEYRIIYVIHKNKLVVIVIDVGHRREVYR